MRNRIAYKQASSVDQKNDQQLEDMTFDKVFEERISGKTMDRPELNKMPEYIRSDDGYQ